MTVTNQENKTIQAGNGITTVFNFTFPIFEDTDLKVYKYLATAGAATSADLLTITTDYTVTISDTTEGGSVTIVSDVPLSTQELLIIRDIEYTQETDIGINVNFPEKNIENELDKSRMIDIQLKEEVDRSIKLNEAYGGSADLTLPTPEASKAIGWDSTGLAMVNLSATELDVSLVSTYGESLVTSADAETARDILELGTSDDVEFNSLTVNSIEGVDATETIKGVNYINKQIIISNNATDANNDIDLTAGNFAFDDGTGSAVATALTKQLDATWAEGTNAGGLDTGTKAISTWYYAYDIYNPTTEVSDALFSLSTTAPTMPSGYTKKKLVGTVRTDASGNILAFTQQGNLFNFDTPLQIVSAGGSATAVTITNMLPVLPVDANISLYLTLTSTGATSFTVWGNLTTVTTQIEGSSIQTNNSFSIAGSGTIYASDGSVNYQNFLIAGGVSNQQARVQSFRINNL